MSRAALLYLTRFLTALGVLLIVTGGVMWWRQVRLEAELLGREERVLLAVTADGVPSILPDFGEDRTGAGPPVVEEVVVVTSTSPIPSPTVRQTSGVPGRINPAVPDEGVEHGNEEETNPKPSPTPDLYPDAEVPPSHLTIPAINMDTDVVQMGWQIKRDVNGNEYSEWVVPDFIAGWHQNSALPGTGGNTVLSGHHNIGGEVFRYLVDLEPGAEVALEADGRTYRYVVEEKYIVKEKGEPIEVRLENNRFIEPTPDERLTLVSCWPYETNTHRVIVIARPVVEQATPDFDTGATIPDADE